MSPAVSDEATMKSLLNRSLISLAAVLAFAGSATAQDWGVNARIGNAQISVQGPNYRSSGGYYKNVRTKVWVPGAYQRQWVPARHGWTYDNCGNRRWGVIQAGYYHEVQSPGRYVWKTQRIWVSNQTHGGRVRNDSRSSRWGRGRTISRRY